MTPLTKRAQTNRDVEAAFEYAHVPALEPNSEQSDATPKTRTTLRISNVCGAHGSKDYA